METESFNLPYPPPIIAPRGLIRNYCTTKTQVCYVDILSKYDDYRSFYSERQAAGDSVILDHSFGLNRIAPSVSVLVNSVRKFQPKVVVLPDYNYQTDRTLLNSFKMLKEIESESISTIGVLQGTNLEDLDRCYKAFRGKVSVIGLPAGLEKIINRNDLVHILGIDQTCVFIEVFKSLAVEKPSHSVVELMWSSIPLRLAYLGELYTTISASSIDFDFGSDYVPEHADINIGQYIKTLTGDLAKYKEPVEALEADYV